jgi:hypothetical protein
MKNKRFKPAANDQSYRQSDEAAEAANDKLGDATVQKASADFYERRTQMWSNFKRGDIWIAIGVYLILASTAFVAL